MANYGGLQPWDNSPQSAMRASDADRERAVDVLKAGFAEGRLSHEEYDQRVGAVYRSRTYGELTALARDLPQGPVVPPMQMAVPQHAMPVMPTFLPTPPAADQRPGDRLAGVRAGRHGLRGLPAVRGGGAGPPGPRSDPPDRGAGRGHGDGRRWCWGISD